MTGPSAPPPWPCPCCGYQIFSEEPGSHQICPVCGWEDDLSKLRFAAQGGGPSPLSLLEAQLAFAARERQGAGDPGQSPDGHCYPRDPTWRRIDPDLDRIEVSRPGRDYGLSYADDSTSYYYWRQAPKDRADEGDPPRRDAT